jgi:hypothetical protein
VLLHSVRRFRCRTSSELRLGRPSSGLHCTVPTAARPDNAT